LQLDGLLRNQDGDSDGALATALALLNLGRSVGDEPFAGAPTWRHGSRWLTVDAIERTLTQGQPSDRALAEMQSALVVEEAVCLLLPRFRGERAGSHEFLTRVDRGQNRLSELSCVPNRGFFERNAEVWLGRIHALHVHASYLHAMNEAVEIAKLPLDQQYPLFFAWRQRNGNADKVGDGLSLAGHIEDYFLRVHALMRCAIVALAAERYRIDHGNWPGNIADLVPNYLDAVPLDPFDATPLRYRRIDQGVVLSSVGPKPVPAYSDSRPIEFRLWNVDQRRQKTP
jgi:hypothetical protein